ncbi:hypothetical protein HYT23_00260 [Candidatus Pacearchaeota archaeon]|nr:hypothetical protein [Candidatus Pacearchaeota archaeon]
MIQRIISKEEQEKRKRKNQFILGGILIFVMIASTLGYSFSSSDKNNVNNENSNKISYNGYEFVNQNGFWQLNLGDFQFSFTNNPNQVQEINAVVNPLSVYSGKALYVSSENIRAEFELNRVFNSVILRKQYACLEGENCNNDYPVKTCVDNFIIIKEDEVANITRRDNCVFISGPEENLTAVVDEFLFKTIGVK